MTIAFELLPGRYAVVQLQAGSPVPVWATNASWYSITSTSDEVSLVCPEQNVPAEVRAERGWRLFRLKGPFPFNLTGILAGFLKPLAEAAVPIFAVSTFNTDYVLVPETKLDAALTALAQSAIVPWPPAAPPAR